MAKRKVIMKNIIYELDNDDIEISSEEEVSGPRIPRLEEHNKNKTQEIEKVKEPNNVEVLIVDSADDSICLIDSPNHALNGGKPTSENVATVNSPEFTSTCQMISNDETESDNVTKSISNGNKTVPVEDRELDSPASLCAAGCQNRIPLVTLRFKNSKIARSCKIKLKQFVIDLLKQHQGDSLTESDNDTDHELDIWPEDLSENCTEEKNQTEEDQHDDNLFFVDTAPCHKFNNDIPTYSQASTIMSNAPESDIDPPKMFRRSPRCFNCDGDHWLRDCKEPRNHSRIADKRQQTTRIGRYHIEDDQKYGHLVPGRISGALRNAMGLKRNQLPLHIYRMRMLGYPPGWLEEARISHSGISMFDSTGTAILDQDEEDGEICEAGSKDKFDIKKILDFPGFNVPASSRYTEEAYLYGLPPISEQDSKIAMLQMLAPNAMKAYKRKKLTFFPSSVNNSLKEGQAEMDLDSGDKNAEFPSVPPLPDEAPPPLPPPPEQPPPPPSSPPPKDDPTTPATKETPADLDSSDLMITSVIQVSDIPVPEDSFIVIDECNDTNSDCGRSSPSLDDLESRKKALMKALEGDASSIDLTDVLESEDYTVVDESPTKAQEDITATTISEVETNDENISNEVEMIKEPSSSPSLEVKQANLTEAIDTPIPEAEETPERAVSTPEPKTGTVKTTSFGTPVLNIASSFKKIPTDDKFSKQICDVINFENLPNSTGKYEKIRHLLKKVKTEVDRIQES